MQYMSSRELGWEMARALPSRRLRPGVAGYRGFRYSLPCSQRRLEVPSGAVTLLLGFEHHLRITDLTVPPTATAALSASADRPRGSSLQALSYNSLLSPLRTRSAIGEHGGSLYGIEVVLVPWAAFRLFGISMCDWGERIADASGLVSGRLDRLTETLAWLPDWQRRFQLLDATLERWWDHGPACSPQVIWAWQELERTAGTVPIRDLATRTDLSLRQLENRFRQQIGLPLKAVARIMRLQRALYLLGHGRDAAETALACGFSDQAHMSREVRRMTGFPPSRLLPARPSSPRPLGGDRVPGRVTTFQVPGDGPSVPEAAEESGLRETG